MKRILLSVFIFILTISIMCGCGNLADRFKPAASDPAPASTGTSVSTDDHPADPPDTDEDIPKPSPAVATAAGYSPDFSFDTMDRDGNTYDESVFSGHKITILNFWEPWCGPCVSEMPDFQKLFAAYSGKGLNIIGVYSTPGMEDDVDSVLRTAGVTFTILHYTDVFDAFQTGYVPTTILVDGNGQVVGETIIGSQSYERWEAVISEYLS